ncbi:MAG: hypothetical protein U5K30_03565 [Acidimicrobiales bacterium]|nr:hypothetical protein [Acidimicrobiales bacterium]
MLRRSVLLIVVCAALALAPPVGAQEDGTTGSTSTTTSTTSTTTSTTSTTSTTVPGQPPPPPSSAPVEDPVGDEELPPEEVPISDITVPGEAGGDVVDGGTASRLIRRELDVARAEAVESEQQVAEAAAAVDELSQRLAASQHELARLGVAQDLAVQRLDLAEKTFRDRVADAVVRGNASELDTLIGATDVNQVEAGRVMLRSVAEADHAAVEEYLAAKAVVDDAVLELVADVDRARHELRDARTPSRRSSRSTPSAGSSSRCSPPAPRSSSGASCSRWPSPTSSSTAGASRA